MSRSENLANELTEQLRGLEDGAVKRIGGIFEEALKRTIRKVLKRLEAIEAQPEYDPRTTPGAFLGSTPTGPQRIEPVEKNQASLYLQGQLLQDLQALVEQFPLSRDQRRELDRELKALFTTAQDLGTEYAQQLTQAQLQPALAVQGQPLPGATSTTSMIPGWEQWTPGQYQEGQRFTRLLNLSAAVVASERDFKSLSLNYRRQRDAATNDHVKASKDYYYKWWRQWGEDVSLEVATQLATGVDSRTLQRTLKKRIPTINEAFKNRAEVVARTESLMAAGEAQERTYRKIGVGFAQYLATNDDRTCEWCAPRHGCLYWLGSIKAPIHPQCRCATSPITLEALVLRNSFATDPADHWEAEAQGMAAKAEKYFKAANGEKAEFKPIGGPGQARTLDGDFPLMEKTGLPQSRKRAKLKASDTFNVPARPWPSGDPVWCPRRGWLDVAAKTAYEAVQREVAAL